MTITIYTAPQPSAKFLDAVYHVQVTGLKRQTTHKFYFETLEYSSSCRPFNGALGDPLVSDSNGQLKFDFHFFDSVIQEWEAVLSAGGSTLNNVNIYAPKQLKIISDDGQSAATAVVSIQAVAVPVAAPRRRYDSSSFPSLN